MVVTHREKSRLSRESIKLSSIIPGVAEFFLTAPGWVECVKC